MGLSEQCEIQEKRVPKKSEKSRNRAPVSVRRQTRPEAKRVRKSIGGKQ